MEKFVCLHCRKKVPNGFDVCPYCKTPVGDEEPYNPGDGKKRVPLPPIEKPADPEDISLHLVCDACKSQNIQVQCVAENENRGCLTALWYAFLLCIPIIGWVALILLILGQKSELKSYAVCQNCGYIWKLN